MKKFKDLKIAVKMIIGFVLVALVSVVVGITSILFIEEIKKADEELFAKNMVGLDMVSGINTSYQRARYNAVRMLAIPEYVSEGSVRTKEFIDQITESFVKYEEEVLGEYDQLMYKDVVNNWNTYRVHLEKYMELLAVGKTAEASDMISNEVAAAGTALQESMDILLAYKLSSAQEKADGNARLAQIALIVMIAIISAGLIFAIVLGISMARMISRPVNAMAEVANKLALGDVEVDIRVESADEVGSLAESLKSVINNIREQARVAEKIAEGDLTVDVKVQSEKDVLGQKLYELVEKNNEVLGNIAVASEQVEAGAKQVSDSSMALSQGATEQASSVEQLTASLEEISAQTKQNAQYASQANELAEIAKKNAMQGNGQMKEMQKAMDEINISSNNISKIIKVIDEIAFQTNILALNAAVEAGRAGQHGKGFAVVAEEVRNLAARSANAAKETTDMIEGSIQKVGMGTKIANETAEALNKIVDDVAKAADLVAEIAVASNEQAAGIAQINQGIMQVSQVVQNNSATSEESAAASEELSSQAVMLRESVNRYKLKNQNTSSFRRTKMDGLFMDPPKQVTVSEERSTKAPGKKKDSSKAKIVLSDDEFGKY